MLTEAKKERIAAQTGAIVDAMKRFVAKAAGELRADIDKQLVSLERRASRHADHLARLEDRIQALEHRGDKP